MGCLVAGDRHALSASWIFLLLSSYNLIVITVKMINNRKRYNSEFSFACTLIFQKKNQIPLESQITEQLFVEKNELAAFVDEKIRDNQGATFDHFSSVYFFLLFFSFFIINERKKKTGCVYFDFTEINVMRDGDLNMRR